MRLGGLLRACRSRIAMHAMYKTDACSQGTVVVVDEDLWSGSLGSLDLVNDCWGCSRPPRCLLSGPLTCVVEAEIVFVEVGFGLARQSRARCPCLPQLWHFRDSFLGLAALFGRRLVLALVLTEREL